MKMLETHDYLYYFSPFLCVVWTVVLCSQPKRGALRRQARIDQHTQEQLQDPWVRLSDSSPEGLSEIHNHHSHHAADRTQSINVHSESSTMSDQENNPELNGIDADMTSDNPSDRTPENPTETPPEGKKAPPVAPKPTWFRQSLRKIRDDQDQKKPAKPKEQRPAVGFNRSFGVRSASSAANLSIKQKIHSFETFSSPEGLEKGGNMRPVPPSTSLPLMEKESRCHPASHGDFGKGKDEIPKEIQANQSACVRETDNTAVSATPSDITSSTSEACSQTAKSSEDEPPSLHSPTDLPLSDTISMDLDSHSAPVYEDRNVLPDQESDLERVDLSTSTETKVLPLETFMRCSQAEGESPLEGTEGDGAQSQGKLLSTTVNASPTDSHPQRGLERESLGKILAFSNQVICHVTSYGNVLHLSCEYYLKVNSNLL